MNEEPDPERKLSSEGFRVSGFRVLGGFGVWGFGLGFGWIGSMDGSAPVVAFLNTLGRRMFL